MLFNATLPAPGPRGPGRPECLLNNAPPFTFTTSFIAHWTFCVFWKQRKNRLLVCENLFIVQRTGRLVLLLIDGFIKLCHDFVLSVAKVGMFYPLKCHWIIRLSSAWTTLLWWCNVMFYFVYVLMQVCGCFVLAICKMVHVHNLTGCWLPGKSTSDPVHCSSDSVATLNDQWRLMLSL